MDFTNIETDAVDDGLIKYVLYKDHSIYIKRVIKINDDNKQRWSLSAFVELKSSDKDFATIADPKSNSNQFDFSGKIILDGDLLPEFFIGFSSLDNLSDKSDLDYCIKKAQSIIENELS